MKVMNSFTSFFTAAALLGSFVVQAAPAAELAQRDVFVPHITSPKAGDVWISGKTAQVTWDTSNAPKQITNRKGSVVLGYDNRLTRLTLADNFDILDGKVTVSVPQVSTGNDYFIDCEYPTSMFVFTSKLTRMLVFGDSGNWSANFTIKGHHN
jgi:hypothetical protein